MQLNTKQKHDKLPQYNYFCNCVLACPLPLLLEEKRCYVFTGQISQWFANCVPREAASVCF